MARPRSLKPSYCIDRSKNRAYVRLDGRSGPRTYLGPPNSQASRDAYDRVVGEWIARGRQPTATPADVARDTTLVSHLIKAFWDHAKDFYTLPVMNGDGSPRINAAGQPVRTTRGELENYRYAIRPLRRLYGHTSLADFGPLALRNVQQEMIRLGWARNYVNRQLNRVRHVFYWGATREMVSGSVVAAIEKVAPLRKNHPGTRETEKVKPVAEEHFRAVLPFLPPHPRAMAELQYYSGIRSAELCAMRTADIDTTGSQWVYRLSEHKTAHHGVSYEKPLGPEARRILSPLLRTDLRAFIFSPADSERLRLEDARTGRQSKIPPSQVHRAAAAARRAERRERKPSDHYTPSSYRRAIERGCEQAFDMPAEMKRSPKDNPDQGLAKAQLRRAWHKKHRWHPHQVRHTFGTRVRQAADLDTSRAALGHTTNRTAEIYAERDLRKVAVIVEQIG